MESKNPIKVQIKNVYKEYEGRNGKIVALNVQITYLRKALRNDSSVKIESLMKKGYVLHTEKGQENSL